MKHVVHLTIVVGVVVLAFAGTGVALENQEITDDDHFDTGSSDLITALGDDTDPRPLQQANLRRGLGDDEDEHDEDDEDDEDDDN